MAIINIQTAPPAGQAAVTSQVSLTQSTLPSLIYIQTTDTFATVTTTGYLTTFKQEGFTFSNNQMALVYTTDEKTVWLQVAITYSGASVLNTVVSLVDPVAPGTVTLPTIANHLAVYTDTAGSLSEDAATAINGGNIQAGLSGTAGTLASFPATASKGSLKVAGVANTGNTDVTISNSAHGQATVYSIGDIGAATGGLVVATTATRTKTVAAAAVAGGNASTTITDAFSTTGSAIIANWNTSANAVNIQKVTPGNGSFVVLSSGDPGVSTLSYIISK